MIGRKLKIAVLMGGNSSEAAVSYKSAANITAVLQDMGHDVVAFDFWPSEIPQLIDYAPDMAFNMMHGRYGEDGCVQGILELLSIPYTGSGVTASSVAMNKHMTKTILDANGIHTPKGILIKKGTVIDIDKLNEDIKSTLNGYPCVIKPNCSGSTVGLTILKEESGLSSAIELAKQEKDDILIEEFISGKEITVSVLGDKPLPVIEISTTREVFDWEAKYTPGYTEHIIPARLPEQLLLTCQDIAVKTSSALGCMGASRVDMIVCESNDVFVLEINTIPGMTKTSLYPDALSHAGISLVDFANYMIEDCLKR